MKKIVFVLLLISCGSDSGVGESTSNTPEGITTSSDNTSFTMTASFESQQGSAHWSVEPINENGNSMGVCEFESKEKTDKTPMYYKNNTADPICSLITIDPISTIDNIIIVSRFKRLKYCIHDGSQKKCGEVLK